MVETVDVFVLGGGLNGCAAAREAAGRGLSVMLAEMGDLGCGASNLPDPRLDGGLHHVERLEFGALRKALAERDALFGAMPHAARPMQTVIPHDPAFVPETETPAQRFVRRFLPWTGGRRPGFMIRWALSYYAGAHREALPPVQRIDLQSRAEGMPLRDGLTTGWEVSDLRTDTTRMVPLLARDAMARGAIVRTYTRLDKARRADGTWHIELEARDGSRSEVIARGLVNAAGPWAAPLAEEIAPGAVLPPVRLVRHSYILVPRLFGHDKAYAVQDRDARFVHVLPFDAEHALIGPSEVDHPDPAAPAFCTTAETTRLVDLANGLFKRAVTAEDVVRSFSGLVVQPMTGKGRGGDMPDGAIAEDAPDGSAPIVTMLGGRAVLARALAEQAITRLTALQGMTTTLWTSGQHLPGGAFAPGTVAQLAADLSAAHPFLDPDQARRLVRAYGTDARAIFDGAGPGRGFGSGLTEAEVKWLLAQEAATCADDILTRRSRLGLFAEDGDAIALDMYLAEREALVAGEGQA
ncbi:MAG: glycerol-3-phosphate dehydrogenase [Pseudooceanicola sp.]